MIKCNVTVCGTISKAAVVRTNNENKAFTAFAVNCVIRQETVSTKQWKSLSPRMERSTIGLTIP